MGRQKDKKKTFVSPCWLFGVAQALQRFFFCLEAKGFLAHFCCAKMRLFILTQRVNQGWALKLSGSTVTWLRVLTNA